MKPIENVRGVTAVKPIQDVGGGGVTAVKLVQNVRGNSCEAY